MKNYLIKKKHSVKKKLKKSESTLAINEFSINTIQGEGAGMGYPASFLRMKGCTLNCSWCDTEWQVGGNYSFTELLDLIVLGEMVVPYSQGQRIILTGGSPLKQQEQIVSFFLEFERRFGFRPVIEVENECVLKPSNEMLLLVDVWNNSPKLSSSGMRPEVAYKPEVLAFMRDSVSAPCWFKFVVSSIHDVLEIIDKYVGPGYVRADQVILMPEASDYIQLQENRKNVMKWCIAFNFRYSTREQLVLNMP